MKNRNISAHSYFLVQESLKQMVGLKTSKQGQFVHGHIPKSFKACKRSGIGTGACTDPRKGLFS